MRINAITPTPYRNNINKNISFKRKMNELVNPFGYDLVQYCRSSNEITLDGIKDIIQKYSPETKVDTMQNYKDKDVRNPGALFSIEFETLIDVSDGEIYVRPTSKTIYLGFEDSKTDLTESRLAEIMHEATHAFQQESDDRTSYEQLCETYYNNSDNIVRIKNTAKIMDTVFIWLEKYMSKAYDICANNSSRRFKIRDNQFYKNFNMPITEFIQTTIEFILSKVSYDKIDYNFLCDYCALRAKNEQEAYKNMLKFKTGAKNRQFIGLKIEMYNVMVKSLTDIVKLQNES